MVETLTGLIYVANEYVHLVAMALLVGGTVFYLWVVPFAIGELKEESQQIVFARARLVFRRVVFVAALFLLISGAFMMARSMWTYTGQQVALFRDVARLSNPTAPLPHVLEHPSVFERPVLWFSLHVILAVTCLLIAISLVRGGKPPHAPISWMRLNFFLLMLAILVAIMTRNARRTLFDSIRPVAKSVPSELRE
jgi:hypothetical protein